MEKYSYGERHSGCWYDGNRGRYILFRVIDLAVRHGWKKTGSWDEDSLEFFDVVREAEEYMQQYAQPGFVFGTKPDGDDWGLWRIEENEYE